MKILKKKCKNLYILKKNNQLIKIGIIIILITVIIVMIIIIIKIRRNLSVNIFMEYG
jgi:hypothetical protein